MSAFVSSENRLHHHFSSWFIVYIITRIRLAISGEKSDICTQQRVREPGFRRKEHEIRRLQCQTEEGFQEHLPHQQLAPGGLENTMLDIAEGTEEHENAKATLANHDGLVAELYRMATTDLYDNGSCCFNQAGERYLKDIRFCGKEWLVDRFKARLKKAGYLAADRKSPASSSHEPAVFLVLRYLHNIERRDIF